MCPPGIPSLEVEPIACFDCGTVLCLRKQVINLALGNIDTMWCLVCLAGHNSQEPEDTLARVKAYLKGRECFASQWNRYKMIDCPDPKRCFPDTCFADESKL